MAAPVCFRGLRLRALSWSRELPCSWCALHTSAVCTKNRAARVRVGKGDKPVTYEEAHAPHYIAHRKGWLSLHTGNLDGEDHAAERTVEDVFLRKFMLGTFPGCLADQVILKRRANQVEICALVLRQLPAYKFYFLSMQVRISLHPPPAFMRPRTWCSSHGEYQLCLYQGCRESLQDSPL
uniref:Mitochondrial ribosomal protein S24 n=1 Tax=Felis catus TaxID=9685 RepID=A0ABI7XH90_FELCA